MEEARVLIVDDHALVAHGIERVLRRCRGVTVVGVAMSAGGAREAVERSQPNLVLLDVHLGDCCGLPLAAEIKQKIPDVRIVVLSAYANPEFVLEALLLGVDGYLEKDEPPERLREAVQRVARGEPAYSESIAAVARALGFKVETNGSVVPPLSKRERDVVRMTAQGSPVGEVAQALGIKPATVRTLLARAQKKLGLASNMLAGPTVAKLLRR